MNTKVSIIVPAYNEEKKIGRCIESLRKQLLKEIEVIIVDDGSKDGTYNLCKEYEKKDARIKVIKKKNEGQGIARNFGIKYASGKYIGFVDADDYVDITMYKKLYEKCEKFDADACMMINNKTRNNFLNSKDVFENEEIKNYIELDMLGNEPENRKDGIIGISACTKIYKLEILKNNNVKFVSERVVFSEDTTFNLEFLQYASKIVLLDECLYTYVHNKESYTHSYNIQYLSRVKNMYRYVINDIYKNNMSEKEKLYFTKTVTLQLINCVMQEVLYYKGRYKDKKENLRMICQDRFVKKLLTEFPYKKLPLQKRILLHCIYKEYVVFIYVCVKLKKMIKR